MDKKKTLIILSLMVVSLIYPGIRLYYILNPVSLTSIETVDLAAQKIKAFATNNRIKGWVRPIEKLDGPDASLDFLKDRMNALLLEYSNWKVLVTEKERNDLVNTINQSLKENIYAITPEDMERLDTQRSGLPDYNINCIWRYIDDNKRECEMTVKIMAFGKNQELKNILLRFSHPQWEQHYSEYFKSVIYRSYISLGTLAVLLIYLLSNLIIFAIRRHKYIKGSIIIETECINLFSEGHYVAADERVRQCLQYLPEGAERTLFIAFKERLSDYCGGDSIGALKKAQIAFVEAIKLRKISEGMKKLSTKNIVIDSIDTTQIKSLLPFNPDLRIAYEDYNKMFSEAKQQDDCDKMIASCRALKESGRLEDAVKKAESLLESFPENKVIVDLILKIKSLQNEAKNKLASAQYELSMGNVTVTEGLLAESARMDAGLNEATELAAKIKEARQYTLLKLIPEKVGKDLYIFKKDIIKVFRKEKLTPDIDINDRHISRDSHLKICFVGNKLIAEHDNLENITLLRGEKLTRAELEDGDILDLAHTYKLIVHIKAEHLAAHQTLIAQPTVNEKAYLPQENQQKENSALGAFIEATDRLFVMLPENNSSVPLSLTAVGIVFDHAGKSRLTVKDGIVMFEHDGSYSILYSGEQLVDNGLRYRISASR